MKLLRRLRAFFRKEKLDTEMSEEIRAHLELHAAENVKRGMTPAEAGYAAQRSFGGVEQVKERVRDARGAVWLEQFFQDLRFAARSLRRNPGFATVAILTLALGIGATTTIFSVVDAVLLRALPFREPERLVMLEDQWLPRFPRFEAKVRDFQAWREQTTSFREVAGFAGTSFNLTADDRPERLGGARVTANFFAVLGVAPALGRSFTPEEDVPGNDQVVLLSHGLWRRRFGGDARVIGTPVQLNGTPFTVVGVMPREFRFPADVELWKPMALVPTDATRGNFIWGIARLEPGVTRVQAQGELDLLMPRLPGNQVWGANVVPLIDHLVGDVRRSLTVLLGATGLVLLVACGNLANLLLLRASVRRREIALRVSLGAGRGRIVRQLLTEAAALSALGGAAGVLLALGGIAGVKKLPFAAIPRLDQVSLDAGVLVFALGVSLAAGLVFGLVPALRVSRTNLRDGLHARGATAGVADRAWMQRLVAAEIALALTLLAGSGLLLKSFWKLAEVRPGFTAEHVLTARINLPPAGYREPHQQARFVADLIEGLGGGPEVGSVAVTTGLPFAAVEDSGVLFAGRVPGSPLGGTAANHYRVTPRYLETMGIALRRGRTFTPQDVAARPAVVLINETMARRFFADEDPIGQRLQIAAPSASREIVGVVADVKQAGPRAAATPQVYEPYFQQPGRAFTLVVRGPAGVARLAAAIRRQVAAIDRLQPVSDLRAMDEIVASSMTRDWFAAALMGLFAGLALTLAAVGIYGVMAYSVAQRTQELGIRLALGASRRSILALVLGGSLRTVLLGLGAGLLAALALTRVLAGLLYDVAPHDPAIFLLVAVALSAVALVAALIPARRAARVDPMVALRCE